MRRFSTGRVGRCHAGILKTLQEQQMKEGPGDIPSCARPTVSWTRAATWGRGNPVKPVGLIVSAFGPSDDATTFGFLVPVELHGRHVAAQAAEILATVNNEKELAAECTALADEVAAAHCKNTPLSNIRSSGRSMLFEVDGFGGRQLMDDANVPSLLAMPYLGDVERTDPIYENTPAGSCGATENPYFWRGAAGEGIGGPHIGVEMIWPMSIMMRAFTATDDEEDSRLHLPADHHRRRNGIHARKFFAPRCREFHPRVVRLAEHPLRGTDPQARKRRENGPAELHPIMKNRAFIVRKALSSDLLRGSERRNVAAPVFSRPCRPWWIGCEPACRRPCERQGVGKLRVC